MEQFIEQLASGLSNGSIYALVALALVMIFVSTDHLNFAQGEMAMFSAFLCWQLLQCLPRSAYLATPPLPGQARLHSSPPIKSW